MMKKEIGCEDDGAKSHGNTIARQTGSVLPKGHSVLGFCFFKYMVIYLKFYHLICQNGHYGSDFILLASKAIPLRESFVANLTCFG